MFVLAIIIGVLQEAARHIGLTIWIVLLAGGLGMARLVAKDRKARERQAAWRVRAQQVSAYRHMTPTEFERALAELCRRDGCTGVRVVGGAGDLGADVIATTPDGRRIVIQAKRYAATNRVGSPDVQKVGGTYAVVHRADLAAVVTTSGYTPAARSYAAQAGIRLYGERELAEWARGGRPPWQ